MQLATLRHGRPWVALSGESPDERVLSQSRGVGLIRSEYVLRATELPISSQVAKRSLQAYLSLAIYRAAAKEVWYRFSDLEARDVTYILESDNIVHDDNPLLGHRGARRIRKFPDEFEAELAAIRNIALNSPNLGFIIPFCRDADEFSSALHMIRASGLTNRVGVMLEIPSAVHDVRNFVTAGATCFIIGLNDLTGLVTGTARSSPDFNFSHPAVLSMIETAWRQTQQTGIPLRVAGNYPMALVDELSYLPDDAWIVHYSDWGSHVDPSLTRYTDRYLSLDLRSKSDQKLVQAGAMHTDNAVVTSGMSIPDRACNG